MNGLLLTDTPFEAFDAFGERARYAGMTADGRGIVAMDDVDEVVQAWGTFYAEDVPVDPNDPRWERIRGPKRKVADGSEAFFIVPLVGDVLWQLYATGYDAMGVFTGVGKVVIVETTKARMADSLTPDAVLRIEEWQDRRVGALV